MYLGENHSDLNTPYSREEALRRYELIDRPAAPSFFGCGIIDAGIGCYAMAELPNRDQLLLHADRLRDMQMTVAADGALQLAHPERLSVVNAYKPGTSRDLILAELQMHQATVKQISREDMTLVRSGPNVWQNPSISFTALHAEGSTPHAGACVAQPCQAVHVMGVVDSSGDEHWAPGYANVVVEAKRRPLLQKLVPGKTGHRPLRVPGKRKLHIPWDRSLHVNRELRYIPIPMHQGRPMHGQEAMAHIMANFAGLVQTKANGGSWMQHEQSELTTAERKLLQLRVNTARLVGSTIQYAKFYTTDMKLTEPATWREIALRLWSVTSIISMRGAAEKLVETGVALVDLFNIPEGGEKRKLSRRMKPYVALPRFGNRINRLRNPANVRRLAGARVLGMPEAGLCPIGLTPSPFDPFTDAASDVFDPGSFRSAYGVVEHLYPTQTLFLQPDGIWIGTCTKSQTVYVGYTQPAIAGNYDLDISPLLSAKLEPGRVLRFRFDAAANTYLPHEQVPLAAAQDHLAEMKEDYGLMQADMPPPADIPRIISAPPPPFVLPLPPVHGHRPSIQAHRLPVLNRLFKTPA